MSATPDQTRLQRIETLARTILEISVGLEAEDWQAVEKASYSSARQSRMLLLEERQAALDKKNRED